MYISLKGKHKENQWYIKPDLIVKEIWLTPFETNIGTIWAFEAKDLTHKNKVIGIGQNQWKNKQDF